MQNQNLKSSLKESIEKAFHFSEPHKALEFLTEIQEFEEAANFVRLKINQLSDNQYYTLRPGSEILREIDPLATTLLCRKMIQPILEETKSKYYNYAVKDLVTCGNLSAKITNWEVYASHAVYFQELEVKHKRKISFWAEYKVALQKQATKETKGLAQKNKEL